MIEVLKQALDALETEVSIDWTNNDEFNASAEKMHDAITSLRQAIAELESQEPVAWADMGTRDVDNDAGLSWTTGHFHTTPLYIHPPQRTEPVFCEYCGGNDENPPDHCMDCARPQRTWQGLTDDEHCNIWYKESLDWMEYGKAIEAKLKQKNGFAEEKI
jgi:hypothetical protein